MHLFTSMSLSNYEKPQIKEYKKGGEGMDKNLLQGKYQYSLMSYRFLEYKCPLCRCSLMNLKEPVTLQ